MKQEQKGGDRVTETKTDGHTDGDTHTHTAEIEKRQGHTEKKEEAEATPGNRKSEQHVWPRPGRAV